MATFIYDSRTEKLTISQALQRLFSLQAQGVDWVVVECQGEAYYHVFEDERCKP